MIGLARGAVCNFARSGAARRGLTTSRALKSAEEVHPGYKSIRAKQEKFGVEDGTPVYIKGGVLDSILYGVTMSACVGALGWMGVFYYKLSEK